jgi:hypothetical protein
MKMQCNGVTGYHEHDFLGQISDYQPIQKGSPRSWLRHCPLCSFIRGTNPFLRPGTHCYKLYSKLTRNNFPKSIRNISESNHIKYVHITEGFLTKPKDDKTRDSPCPSEVLLKSVCLWTATLGRPTCVRHIVSPTLKLGLSIGNF